MAELRPEETLANQHLERLDAVSRKMECAWGVNRLQRCVGAELLAKWDRQWAKLDQAVNEARYLEVAELAQGCVRAWGALEAAAMAAGYKPDIGQCMEFKTGTGVVFRICASRLDAEKPQPEGYEVYSLEEVVNVLYSQRLVNIIANTEASKKPERPEIKPVSKEYWEAGGDPLPAL